LTISPAQPDVHDQGTSQGASQGASHGGSCGGSRSGSHSVSQGVSRGVSHSISQDASLCDPQADGIRIPAVSTCTVSYAIPQSVSARIVSHAISQSVSNQRLGPSIPTINSAVQQEPSTIKTLHRTVSHTPPAFGSSPSQDMFVDGTEEGNKEADEEGNEEVDEEANFDEDNIYIEGQGFTEDNGIDNNMEYEEGFHGGSDNIMHLSDRDNQTYPGNNQVRRPAQAPDQSAYLYDKDFDDAGVAGIDRNHRNDCTTSRRDKDHHINVAQVPKRTSLQHIDKQAQSRSNAPVVVSTHPFCHYVLTLFSA
jgi:hypothetical protein